MKRIDIIGQNGNDGLHYKEVTTVSNKYQREIKPGVFVDVYDVLKAFNVTCPAMAHGIKKCLAPGQRGVKNSIQDKNEAIASINRSIEMENMNTGDLNRLINAVETDKPELYHGDMREVDWTELKEEQDNTESMQTLACTAGGCEI